jgi:hypothetical protein
MQILHERGTRPGYTTKKERSSKKAKADKDADTDKDKEKKKERSSSREGSREALREAWARPGIHPRRWSSGAKARRRRRRGIPTGAPRAANVLATRWASLN